MIGGIIINSDNFNTPDSEAGNHINKLELMEKDVCNIPLIFAEMFKDEINANDEQKLYNGIKRVVRKYSGDTKVYAALNEFTRVISGGTALDEILKLTIEEASDPTLASRLTVDNRCDLH